MADVPEDQDELTEEEAAKRRDTALKRALNMKPQPRKSKPKGKRKPEKQRIGS